MAITRTAAYAKIRLRLGDRATRRDGTSITTPRYANADLATAIDDAIRDRQPLLQSLDRTFYLSTFDFIGQTNAITADTSSTTLPVVANEQYAVPSNFKEFVRLARRDLTNLPTVRIVPYEHQDAIYYGTTGGGIFSGFYSDYPSSLSSSQETVALVTYNATGTATNRLRIRPAPASTSYTYRLFFIRVPTAPDADADTLDIPAGWQEVVCLDAAIELAASTNSGVLSTLVGLRDQALAARMDDPGQRYAGRRIIGDVRI